MFSKTPALTAIAIAAALYLLGSTAAYAAPKKLDCKQPCVDSFEIVDGTVGSADIGTGAVGSDEIENGSIMPEDLGFDPDTTLDQAGVEALGFVPGDHTEDTALDQAGVESLGFVPEDHTNNTTLGQAGVEALGFVTGAHGSTDTSAATRCEAGEVLVAGGNGVCIPLLGEMRTVVGSSSCPCPFLEDWGPFSDFSWFAGAGNTCDGGAVFGNAGFEENFFTLLGPSDAIGVVQQPSEMLPDTIAVCTMTAAGTVSEPIPLVDEGAVAECVTDIRAAARVLGVSCPRPPSFDQRSLLARLGGGIVEPLPPQVFVTSGTYSGNLVAAATGLNANFSGTGLEAGDLICNHHAQNAGLASGFVAWLSDDNTDAVDRLPSNGPWELVNGTPVTTEFVNLTDGSLVAPIDRTESGDLVPANAAVWTGTIGDGTAFDSPFERFCQGWASGSSQILGIVGSVSAPDAGWTVDDVRVCTGPHRLYCFR